MKRIIFLNTTILTSNGDFRLEPITLETARAILCSHPDVPRLSAIGHDSTAQIMTSLLGEPVAVNRIQYEQIEGDCCICLKLKGRAPEGVILDVASIEAIGYEFKKLTQIF